MNKGTEIGEKIRKIRKSRHETQAQFAKRAGVIQATVSAWERDEDTPSPLHCMILALLASGPDREWFAARAGAKTTPVVRELRNIQEEQTGTAVEGELVRVACELRTSRGSIWSDRFITLPAELLASPTSTVCLVIDETGTTPMLFAGDIIVLDTSNNNSKDLRPFWDQVVLAERSPLATWTEEWEHLLGTWREHLAFGRLRPKRVDIFSPLFVASVGPFDDSGTRWKAGDTGMLVGRWESFRPPDFAPGIKDEIAYEAEAERQALMKIRLDEGFKILGRVVGWFRPPRRRR